MKFLQACYNPRVIVVAVAIAAGVFLVAPGALAVAAPFLFLAICPLSMVLMMRTMGRMETMDRTSSSESSGDASLTPAGPAARAAALRMQLAAVDREQRRLADEITGLDGEAGRVPTASDPLGRMADGPATPPRVDAAGA